MQRARCGLRPARSNPASTRAVGVTQAASTSGSSNATLVFIIGDRYIVAMALAIGIALFLLTVLGMEGFAYVMHRWVMHGPGWFLHASHHRPRTGRWEWNDLYAAIFAIPSIVLLLGGVQLGWWPGVTWIGAGIAAYGAIYFGFHDVIVHERLGRHVLPRSSYMKRIVQAHRLHHAIGARRGAVSFGFLWAPPPARLKAELQRRGRENRAARPEISDVTQ